MENQENPKRKFYSFNLTIEDKVVGAILLSLLSCLISVGFTIFYEPSWVNKIVSSNEQLKSKINKETLVLIGGGTIHEYFHINDIYKDCYKQMDSASIISVRVASLDAYKTLKDETEDSPHGWIVLSSTKAKREDFMNKEEADEFINTKRRIVEYYLGKDKLLVITNKIQISPKKDSIHISELNNFLESSGSNISIYTTSENSGTLKVYKEKTGYDFKSKRVFDLNTTFPAEEPYVILCSDIYKPQAYKYKNLNTNLYSVLESKNKPIEKELYLYFTINCDGSSLKISNSIEKFMRIIKKDFDIKKVKLTNELIVKYD